MLNPSLKYVGTKARVDFKGDCLKQDKVSFDHGKIVNIYIVYEINKNFNSNSYPTLANCFSGTVKLGKYIDIDRYKYSRYGIGFDGKEFFSVGDKVGRNVTNWLQKNCI